MSNVHDYVQDLCLIEGQQYRGDCPTCRGRGTFTANKEDGVVVYNCYKLGCTVRGFNAVGLTVDEIKQRIRSLKEDYYDSETLDPLVWPEYVVDPKPDHTLLKRFVKRWDLETEDIMYDVKDRRAVFPIRKKGIMIDAVGRALDGAVPKWYRYTGNANVYTHVYGKPSGVAVLVEDVISAIVAAKECPGLTGMAILGTSLSTAHIEYLENYYRVIVALDPDATSKAVQFKREIESWTGMKAQALKLEDDLKYKVAEDLERLRSMV